jgi:outer membrane immunogenic protein
MKKLLLGTVALVALGATSPVLAADLAARPYTKAPAYAAPIYNWTGFYIGGHIGGAFGGNNNFAGFGGNNDGRFLGGVQVGADYQFAPNWVLGVEGQYSWLGNNNNTVVFTGAGAGFTYTNNQRALGSVTGRVGYTWGPAMLYVKGGYAYSDNSETLLSGTTPAIFSFDSGHRDGYTVGAGLEYMFAPNWSAKAEYMYYDFGSSRFVNPTQLVSFGSFRTEDHTVKVGLNYRFNLGGPVAPARY